MAKHINCSLNMEETQKMGYKKNDLYIIGKKVHLRTKPIAIVTHKEQYECLLKLYQDIAYDDMQIYTSEIKSKLSGYKQQDREKKRDISDNIVYCDVIEKLVASKLQCYYCKVNVNILYRNIKQEDQWTLERINNDISHTTNNCEICCLRCNLKRRCMPSYVYKKSKEIGKVVKLRD